VSSSRFCNVNIVIMLAWAFCATSARSKAQPPNATSSATIANTRMKYLSGRPHTCEDLFLRHAPQDQQASKRNHWSKARGRAQPPRSAGRGRLRTSAFSRGGHQAKLFSENILWLHGAMRRSRPDTVPGYPIRIDPDRIKPGRLSLPNPYCFPTKASDSAGNNLHQHAYRPARGILYLTSTGRIKSP
jgi:hypothetical protein